MQFRELVSILQASVSPVILISGVGLLILSITNRFGRVVDRSRQLRGALRSASQHEHERLDSQLTILFRRARLLRSSIGCAALSVLMAALLVIVLFSSAVLQLEMVLLSALIFIGCLVSLIASLLVLLQDMNLSLVALKLELELKEEVAG